MKTLRLHIGLIILLFYAASAHSQSISIELSARWKKGIDIFNKDSTVYFPELIITYRNNSDTSYYFNKVSESRYGLPMLPRSALIQYPIEEFLNPNYLKRAKFHGNYVNQKYHVKISRDAHYSKGWKVVSDTIWNGPQTINMINDCLSDIYSYIYHEIICMPNIYEYIRREIVNKQPHPSKKFKFFFSVSDITPDEILTNVKDKFVFLRPGGIYTDIYNLVGFEIIKGNFTFYVNQSSLQAYVSTPIWDKTQSKYLQLKTALPKVVGEYKLYSGSFNSNKIAITFD